MKKCYYMNDKDRKNLEYLLSHCTRMQSHIDYFGDDWIEFSTNEHYQAACGLEILEIGYIKRLSPEFLEEHNQIDWSGLIGLRIIYAHHYEGIMYDVVWEVIKKEIPELREYLKTIL